MIQIFEKSVPSRGTSLRKTKFDGHMPVMRTLSLQRCSRLLVERRRTCNVCLANQAKRYNSSIPFNPSEVPQPSESVHLGQVVREESTVVKDKEDVHPNRPHLKNRGQYFVTTPIFYVNGGIIDFDVLD